MKLIPLVAVLLGLPAVASAGAKLAGQATMTPGSVSLPNFAIGSAVPSFAIPPMMPTNLVLPENFFSVPIVPILAQAQLQPAQVQRAYAPAPMIEPGSQDHQIVGEISGKPVALSLSAVSRDGSRFDNASSKSRSPLADLGGLTDSAGLGVVVGGGSAVDEMNTYRPGRRSFVDEKKPTKKPADKAGKPRTGKKLIDALKSEARQEGYSSYALYAVNNLTDKTEIEEFVRYYTSVNRNGLANLRFAVIEGNEFVSGTKRKWQHALIATAD